MKARKLIAMLLVVATLMSFAPMAVFAAEGDTYTVTVQYMAVGGPLDGREVAAAWSGSFAEGSAYNTTVTLPTVEGYIAQAPEEVAGVETSMADGKLTFGFDALDYHKTILVTYVPAAVGMTVEYYQQNAENDEYKLVDTATFPEAKTGDAISQYVSYENNTGLKVYDGSYALWFDSSKTVAADGKTLVKVYYDREYYLLSFDLDGGYGVDPQFLRYGETVETVGTPVRPGYTFKGWDVAVPTTMPANNLQLTAQWEEVETAEYTVVFWGENPNDEGYSYIKSVETSGTPGAEAAYSSVSSGFDADLWTFDHADEVTINADGTTVVNVYYDRAEYTFTYQVSSKTVHSFTAKWGANITSQWKFTGSNGTTYPQSNTSWTPQNSSTYKQRITMMVLMPAENITFKHTTTNNTSRTFYYYTASLPGETGDRVFENTNYDLEFDLVNDFNYLYYDEDFFELEGFDRYKSARANGNEYPIGNGTSAISELYFYYTRNSYTLDFNNGTGVVKSESVLYEANLGTFEDFVPEMPDIYPEGSHVFGGWYQNPECTGDEVVLSETTMPASNMILYAKWEPVEFTVTTYLTDAQTDAQLLKTEKVPYGSFATAPENVKNDPYTFISWFYMDGEVEKAFDFESMQITKDMVVYGKWKATTPVNYTVKFQLADGTAVAASITAKALPFTGVTAEAKVGDELYADYQTGYFPDSPSKSLDVTGDEASNVITFIYTPAQKVPYTVKYLLAGTDTEVPMSDVMKEKGYENYLDYSNKTVSNNTKVVVTENALIIPGYLADAPQKRLIVTADGKAELIFYYTENNTQAYIQETHYKVKDGVNYVYQDLQPVLGTIGEDYSRSALTITNYVLSYVTINGEKWTGTGDPTAELTNAGLHFEFYYIPNEFYVYHMSDGSTDTYALPQFAQFDVTSVVKEGYLYGGLYDGPNADEYDAYTYENLAAAYNGDPTDGMNLTPAAGETYFLKEVDNRYIRPGMYHVWDTRDLDTDATGKVIGDGKPDNTLHAIYLVTGIDSANYMEVGFNIDGVDVKDNTVNSTFRVEFLKQNPVPDENGEYPEDQLDPARCVDYDINDFFQGEKAALTGFLHVNAYGVANQKFTYGAYFITPDGIRVDGVRTRYVAHDGTTYDMVNTLSERESTCTDVVENDAADSVEYTTLTLRNAYSILGQAATPVYTINMVNGSTTETVRVLGGDHTGTIGYTEKAGYVFAGWYTNKACTKPADFSDIQSDMTVYPKYVSAKQVTTKTTALGKLMTVNVSVPGTDLTQVGVSYTLDGETTNVLCKKSQSLISGLKKLLGSKSTTYTASWNMKGLTNGDTFTVTSYWVTADGTMVEIETNDFAYARNRISVQ